MTALTLFDALAVREEAIERVGKHADPDWLDNAHAALICAASVLPNFTTDDVWERIPPDCTTHQPAAMGNVVSAAVRAHLIVKVRGEFRPSRLGRTHRDLQVWRQA